MNRFYSKLASVIDGLFILIYLFCRTWLDNAGDQPVVINRTVSNIANLIRSNSQVQAHLRQTIDFYLTNGILPTLADLNSGAKLLRLDSLPPTPVGPISGLDVVGCGYDIFTLQSRSCILDTSNSSENEVWSDPYNQNVSYLLPNGFFATNTPESLTVVSKYLDFEMHLDSDHFRMQQYWSHRSKIIFDIRYASNHGQNQVLDMKNMLINVRQNFIVGFIKIITILSYV
jgi:hypothetical protein